MSADRDNPLNAELDKLNQQRRENIELSFPELKREDYTSDEAFTEALTEQYRCLRMNEYEVEARRQALEMYTASRNQTNINHDIWKFPLDRTAPADSCVITAPKRQPMLNPDGPDNGWRRGGKIASCAKTAVSVVGQVSDNLGYCGQDNITHGTGGGSLASAAGVHDGLANKEYKRTGTLRDLVSSGEIGPGSIVSVPSPGNGGSNMHAMVLADVVRDKDDKVVGYFLQGNNKTSFTYYDINDTKGRNVQNVVCTATNAWMGDRIDNEITGKSPEELQAMIAETKGRMLEPGGRLEKLTSVEKVMVAPAAATILGTQRFLPAVQQAAAKFMDQCTYEECNLQQKNSALFRVASSVEFDAKKILTPDDLPGMQDIEVPDSIQVNPLSGEPLNGVKKRSPAEESGTVRAPAAEKTAPTASVSAEGEVNGDTPPRILAENEPAAEKDLEAVYTSEEKAVVAEMFTRLDENDWQQLVEAYLGAVNKEAPVAEVMRGEAAYTAVTAEAPSLVDGLSAEVPVNDAVGEDERPVLAAALTDDKSAVDGLFGSLMTALTANDEKDLDDSMKMASNLLFSFLDGQTDENGMPSLSDFMDYLSYNDDVVLAQNMDKETEKTSSLMTPSLMMMMRNGGRA